MRAMGQETMIAKLRREPVRARAFGFACKRYTDSDTARPYVPGTALTTPPNLGCAEIVHGVVLEWVQEAC